MTLDPAVGVTTKKWKIVRVMSRRKRRREVAAGEDVDPPAKCAASVSSQPCGNAGGASTVPDTELRIGKDDLPTVLDDDALEELLRVRPVLKRLIVDWRPDGRKLDVDIVSKHCQNLVELDLTRFRLDPWSLEQLCKACPKLKKVKLPWKSDDECAEVLLRNLQHLRSLDLSHSQVTGRFFKTRNLSIEKLSLKGCRHLRRKTFVRSSHPAKNIPKTSQWEKFRELDLSDSKIPHVKIAQIADYFPQLESLSLINAKFSFVTPDAPQRDLLEQHQVPLRLRELDVSGVQGLASSDLAAILHRSTKLNFFSGH